MSKYALVAAPSSTVVHVSHSVRNLAGIDFHETTICGREIGAAWIDLTDADAVNHRQCTGCERQDAFAEFDRATALEHHEMPPALTRLAPACTIP